MDAITATKPESLSGIPAGREKVSSRLWLISGALVVLIAYSLPFLVNHLRHDPFLNVAIEDEKIYLARVMDAYRGGSLGNPYLADHENAERFMPEMGERFLAVVARVTGMPPLRVEATSRIVLPVFIYFFIWVLARGFNMGPRLAMLAAMLPPLAPAMAWSDGPIHGTTFLRYFRAISPAFYVALLLLVLGLVQMAWRNATWWNGVLAGAGLGLLFYATPVYYWSFAIGGVTCLGLISTGSVRVRMLTSLSIALIIGLPFFASAWNRARLPDVQATLARFDLLTPGRAPDISVMHKLILSALVLAPVLFWRQRLGDTGRFLIPFMCVGPLLMVQNLVTNRHLQGVHWVECLIPVWSLAAVTFLQNSPGSFRPAYITALTVVLVSGSIFLQVIAYAGWEESLKEDVKFWALDALMPHTLDWLNEHTPPNSVVLADPDVMDSLVLFTHNKVYWADYASQHVIPEAEVQARTNSLVSWRPDGTFHLQYRVDFYLGTGSTCDRLNGKQFLYRDRVEGTCVLAVASQ